jgi:ubiquinone/menaquinone biosynthesis C-methylase UbiE
MKLTDAILLIQPAFNGMAVNENWADLGCGSGTFTKALAFLLGEGNTVFAVDKERQIINSKTGATASIEFNKLDFIYDKLPFHNLDGILIANAIHYVQDKDLLIEKLKQHLKQEGRWIIVEYDTERTNTWVPFPLSFERLTKLFSRHGFRKIERIGQRNSIYRRDEMYACSIEHRS